MTEVEAREWFVDRYPATTVERLDQFVSMLRKEADRQSLIARSTFAEIWSRHLLDSGQLAALGVGDGAWLDVGSGGGLPGLVLAILNSAPVTLVEPRRLRAEFLDRAAKRLNLDNASVVLGKVQSIQGRFAFVTARAVAPANDLFTWTEQLVSRETRYLLPRGRTAIEELENARRAWHGAFHVEQSLTNPDSGIIVATGVRRR